MAFIKTGTKWLDLPFTDAGSGTTIGDIVLIGTTYALSYSTLAAGEAGIGVYYCAKCKAPKTTGVGLDITVGNTCFVDPLALVVSEAQGSGHLPVGTAIRDAGEDDTHVWMHFDGRA